MATVVTDAPTATGSAPTVPRYFYFDTLTCNKPLPQLEAPPSLARQRDLVPTVGTDSSEDSAATQGNNKKQNTNATPDRLSTGPQARFHKSASQAAADLVPRTIQHRVLVGIPVNSSDTLLQKQAAVKAWLARFLMHLKLKNNKHPAPVIYPWLETSKINGKPSPALTSSDVLGMSFDQLRAEYFHRPNNLFRTSKFYVRLFLGCTKHPNMSVHAHVFKVLQSMKDMTITLSSDILQAESTQKIGFFLGMPVSNGVELNGVSKEISTALGIPISIFRAPIAHITADNQLVQELRDRKREESNNIRPIWAYCVECDSRNIQAATEQLLALYPGPVDMAAVHPAGWRCIFVPTNLSEPGSFEQLKDVIHHHRGICALFRQTDPLYGIKELDLPLLPGSTLTVRRILMDLAGNQSSREPYIFMDLFVRSGKVFGQVHDSNREQLDMVSLHLHAIIKHFAPALVKDAYQDPAIRHLFHTNLDLCFTEEYRLANQSVSFDHTRGVFTTANDAAISHLHALLQDLAQQEDNSVGSPSGMTYVSAYDWSSLPHRPWEASAAIDVDDNASVASGLTNFSGLSGASVQSEGTKRANQLEQQLKEFKLETAKQLEALQLENDRLRAAASPSRSKSYRDAASLSEDAMELDSAEESIASPPRPQRKHQQQPASQAAARSKGSGPVP